jgi:Ca-activated chloride channel family protein
MASPKKRFALASLIRIKNARLSNPQIPCDRRGAMMVFVAVLVVAFLAMVAISVEIAHIQLARTELRTATDAASKAAALELSRSQDINLAIATGTEAAAQNEVIGAPLLLSPSDFQFGNSSQNQATGRFDFSPPRTPTNSVRVVGKRTSGSRSGPISLFFGEFLGTSIFEPQAIATATFINRDVVLVVDRSGSMAGQLLIDLQAALLLFTQTLSDTPVDEFVGMASYEAVATIDSQLTPNLAEIDAAARGLRASGFTSISRGMEAGQQIFQNGRSARFVQRTMIVMTDGLHNRGPEPRIVAQAIADQNVVIHTITFGAAADIPRMREVATIGQGRHFHAANGLQLAGIYREIALSLSTLLTE